MHKVNYPVAGPSISSKEIEYVTDAVKNSWYENANDYITKFEKSFAKYLNRKYAISLPSCTSGLHLSLLALGIGPGDEVIVPDATWIASAAPISYVGANPIFADIDPNTWCLSKKTIEPLITDKTKAIIAVNLYGHMPAYDDILQLGIPVIEDAAESIGSLYKNKLSGTFGVTSCFSFHGSKTMVTGEGGMLVTDSEQIFNKCMILRDHGRNPGDLLFQNIQVGYKYKMSNLQAALGLAQLERIEELVNIKRAIFNNYKQALSELDLEEKISLNPAEDSTYNSYWMTTVLLNSKFKLNKFDAINLLNKYKISTRPFFNPLSSLKAYSNFNDTVRAQQYNHNSYDISNRGINLPSAAVISKEDTNYIISKLLDIM